jgi:hypothetical protein
MLRECLYNLVSVHHISSLVTSHLLHIANRAGLIMITRSGQWLGLERAAVLLYQRVEAGHLLHLRLRHDGRLLLSLLLC